MKRVRHLLAAMAAPEPVRGPPHPGHLTGDRRTGPELPHPLRRNSGGQAAAKKRRQSCTAGPDPFKKDPGVTDDPCDEFPFAGSVEGGTNGSECTEIIPTKTAGAWHVDVVRDSPHGAYAPCIRAHVPLTENTGREVNSAGPSSRTASSRGSRTR